LKVDALAFRLFASNNVLNVWYTPLPHGETVRFLKISHFFVVVGQELVHCIEQFLGGVKALLLNSTAKTFTRDLAGWSFACRILVALSMTRRLDAATTC
jgi:hypothetical protein